MNYKKIVFFGFSISVLVTFSGCGAKGEQFNGFKTPSENKSMIYVYRPTNFVGAGIYYDVNINDNYLKNENQIIGTLRNGGYFEKELIPTKYLELWAKTESKSAVTLDLKPNETYCIKGGVEFGLAVGRPTLSIVDKVTCEKEILETQKSFD